MEFQTIKAVFGMCPCANSEDHLDQFAVSFSSRQKFTFLFSRKLFKFGAYANSLDHLDCSHGVLAVFYEKKIISESKFLSPPIQAVVRTCVCAISPDQFTVSFIWRQKFIFLFFEEAVRIWSFCEFC